MFINLMQGPYLTDDEFQEEVARRREYLQLTGEPGDIACPLCGSQGDAVAGGAGGR